jgi:hypothetical protein
MPGVVSALKTYYNIGSLREPIDYFTFSFIAPLGPNYYYIGQRELTFLIGVEF